MASDLAKRLAEGAAEGAKPLVARGQQLPLHFESVEEEVNFLGLLSLLDFGSGYKEELEAGMSEARKLDEIMLFGVMHMHISGIDLGADGLRTINGFQIEQHFGIPSHVEEEALGGAIRASVPGPLNPFVELMATALNQTGAKLEDLKCKTIGHFLVDRCRELGPDLDAEAAVKLLAETFPTFDDSIPANLTSSGEKILPGRKAVEFIERLEDRFHEELAPGEPAEALRYLLRKTSVSKLPVKVDAQIIETMHAKGLPLGEDVSSNETDNSTIKLNLVKNEHNDVEREHKLRAAAWVNAREIMADAVLEGKDVTARQLDGFLRSAGSGEEEAKADSFKLIVQGTKHY